MKEIGLLILLASLMLVSLVSCGQTSPNTLSLTSSDMTAIMQIFPNPPSPNQTSEIQLKLADISGNPISKADVTAELRNLDVEMAAIQVKLTDSGNGNYLTPVMFTLPGEWEVKIKVTSQDQIEGFRFTINSK